MGLMFFDGFTYEVERADCYSAMGQDNPPEQLFVRVIGLGVRKSWARLTHATDETRLPRPGDVGPLYLQIDNYMYQYPSAHVKLVTGVEMFVSSLPKWVITFNVAPDPMQSPKSMVDWVFTLKPIPTYPDFRFYRSDKHGE